MKPYDRILESGNKSLDDPPHTHPCLIQLSNDLVPRRRDEGQRAPHASVAIQLSDKTLALFHLNSPPETSEG